jgi:hypothetical protein
MVQSFACYPFPYARRETNTVMARPKLTAVLLLRFLHLMRPEASFGGAAHDA